MNTRPVWFKKSDIDENRDWCRRWREGSYDSGSRDHDGWPIEMYGLVQWIEGVIESWDEAPDDPLTPVEQVLNEDDHFMLCTWQTKAVKILRELGWPDKLVS